MNVLRRIVLNDPVKIDFLTMNDSPSVIEMEGSSRGSRRQNIELLSDSSSPIRRSNRIHEKRKHNLSNPEEIPVSSVVPQFDAALADNHNHNDDDDDDNVIVISETVRQMPSSRDRRRRRIQSPGTRRNRRRTADLDDEITVVSETIRQAPVPDLVVVSSRVNRTSNRPQLGQNYMDVPSDFRDGGIFRRAQNGRSSSIGNSRHAREINYGGFLDFIPASLFQNRFAFRSRNDAALLDHMHDVPANLSPGNSYEQNLQLAEQLGSVKSGFTDAQIGHLPEITYKTGSSLEDKPCSICIEPYKNNEKLLLLVPCTHKFHKKCIKPWLHNNRTCPICRSQISFQ